MKEESYPLQKGTISSEQDQEKFVSLLTLQKEEQNASALHAKEGKGEPSKEYANEDLPRNFKSRPGGARSLQPSTKMTKEEVPKIPAETSADHLDSSPYQEYIDGKEHMPKESNKKSPRK